MFVLILILDSIDIDLHVNKTYTTNRHMVF